MMIFLIVCLSVYLSVYLSVCLSVNFDIDDLKINAGSHTYHTQACVKTVRPTTYTYCYRSILLSW